MLAETDPATGLPELPKGHFFKVHKYNKKRRAYKVTVQRTTWWMGPFNKRVTTAEEWAGRASKDEIRDAAGVLRRGWKIRDYLNDLALRESGRDDKLVGNYKPGKKSVTGMISKEMKD